MTSATILTYNNARTIGLTLKSLETVVDDLVIVDDGSTDETISIIESQWPSARIFYRSLAGDFAAQRNYALEECQHDWVVIIDSDESLSSELAASIKDVISTAQAGVQKAYNCLCENENFAGHSTIKLERPILMRRELGFSSSVHERLDEKMALLNGKLIHTCWEGVDEFVNDLNVYSTYKAKKWIIEKRNYSLSMLVMRQLASFVYFFLKRYFGEKRYKHGWKGLLYCFAWASEELFAGMKYCEMKESERTQLN